ncbi:MAG: glucose/galactose MFS transporter [Bacteroidetes bacterium HGW-Bacteroidetes-17]|jgi:glucose/galactose transporter|nr:MAG: glucose/galactose MFS transporter [Bacteroidetes bacterium HGW-Bacteroidetes-17]
MSSIKQNKNSYVISISIIGALFFIFGFVTWLNATLIPYLKIACELSTDAEAYLVTSAFYISYFVMALPSSWVLKKIGFKNGMSLGLFVMAIGSLVFIPAALSRTYGLFLTGLFIQGTGLSILQTAANPYVTILGPIESAAKRISIMGIANKVAGILSPLILGVIVLDGIDNLVENLKVMTISEKAIELDQLAERVILPYIIMAIVLVVLSILLKFMALPDINEEEEIEDVIRKKESIFQHTYLWLGVLALFLYVGAEVIAVDTLIGYGKFLGFDFSTAKFFASFTLGGMVFGYVLGILLIPKYLKQENALKYSAILGVLFSIAAILSSGYVSVTAIALLGFANAIMWPAIWPLAIAGLGKYTKIGSAFLIMAIAGGAILTLIYGTLSDMPAIGAQKAYVLLIPCYLFILYFATKGHLIGKSKK